jgi:hypothetical protein
LCKKHVGSQWTTLFFAVWLPEIFCYWHLFEISQVMPKPMV